MRKDPTEFRERFKRWKAGERVYDSGYATPTMKEESDYKTWKETLPVNLLSESDYNLRRAYQLGYKPELQDDGHYHLPTRDEKTGEILKGDFHPTLLEGLAIDNDLGYIPIRKNGKYYTKSWLEYKSVPAYEDGKTPEETYYGKHLPTVTIEGHKPTLWENIGNWFVDASKRAAFNENPAVMTASGWTPYSDGSTRLDAFNTPERNLLADNLVEIGMSGAGDVWGGPLAEWAIGKALKLMKPALQKLTNPVLKITLKNAAKITDAQWDDAYYAAIDKNDMAEVQRLRDLHFKAKAPNTKAINPDGTPTKTFHTVSDEYDPNFVEFNPHIEGTHSAIYTSDDPFVSGTYSSKLVSEAERDFIIELIRLREIADYENRIESYKQRFKHIYEPYFNKRKARKLILKNHPWVNGKTEPARQKQLYLNLENPVEIDADGRSWANLPLYQLPKDVYDLMRVDLRTNLLTGGYSTRSLEAAQKAAGNYDGSIIKNVIDYSGRKLYESIFRPSTVYQVNSPNNLKLANPITYDDAGKIIPLSKRDNFKIKDIRYVLPWVFGGAIATKYYNE